MKLSERFINAIDEDRIVSGKNAHAIEDAVNFIRKYENAEEQGRLFWLPCDVGDMVYYRRGQYIIGDTVRRIIIDEFGNRAVLDCHNKEFDFEDFGKKAFLTSAEAEAALKEGHDDGTA